MSEVSMGLYWWQGLGIAIACAVIWCPNRAVAQIIPDNTLPNNSSVTFNGKTTIIEGGTTRGANLFHSLREFSIPRGSEALFNNVQDIQNILTRVTGGAISNIDGLIRANGKANLFVINPSGIVFGSNARLDIGGSFVASTANSLKFADGFEFSATNPQTTPLLTISVPTGLQYGSNTKNVQVRESILEVKPGQTLALVGGDVSVEGGGLGILRSPSGRIELGGVADSGMVEITGQQSGDVFRLTSLLFPETVQRSNILLNNIAVVDITGSGGGSIAVNARNLDVLGGSVLSAGIGEGLGSIGTVAGDITLNATGDIKFVGSNAFNIVRAKAIGNGGNIKISDGSFSLTDGARLQTSTLGNGNAGNVNIYTTGAVTISGIKDGVPNGIFSIVGTGAKGNSGNITISSSSFSLSDGALLATITFGEGNTGNILVDAKGSLTISGVKDGFFSGISSFVGTEAKGNGGNITISGSSFSLTDGASLFAGTVGEGNAGNVLVDAKGAVTISGVKDGFPSGISSNVGSGAKGNGGNITISGSSFSLTDGANLSASTFGNGNTGNVLVNTKSAVTISGRKEGNPSGIFSLVGTEAKGNSGNITIFGSSFSLTDSAQLDTSTSGNGNAGNVLVDVTGAVTISGRKEGASGGILSAVGTKAKGDGGNITISGGSFSLTDGAQLFASTGGNGDAGNVLVDVTGAVTISGVKDGITSSIFSTVGTEAKGNGGNITISGNSFSLTDGARLVASTFGNGNAGNLNVNITDAVIISGVKDGIRSGMFSAIETTQAKGDGGKITISGGSFSLTDSALLQASTFGEGSAGNVKIDVTGAVTISGVSGGIFSAVGTEAKGKGGNITIFGGSFSLTDGAILSTGTVGNGNAGNVLVDVTGGAVTISGVKEGIPSGIFSSVGTVGSVGTDVKGKGGNITISADSLSLIDGAGLFASTLGEGNAGSVFVQAKDFVALAGGARIFSTVESQGLGNGGNINISTDKLFLKNGVQITASSTGNGAAGNLFVNARTLLLDNSTLSTDTRSRDNNPNLEQATITLRATDLVLLRHSSKITTNARGENVIGGNINIKTNFLAAFENSDISANSTDFRGGNVTINAKGIFGIQFRDVASPQTNDITATGASRELGGNVEITTPDIDPTSGLVELPINLDDASRQISTACTPGTRQFQNTFVATGRGGLPINPTEPLQDSSTVSTWVRLRPRPENLAKTTISPQPTAVSNTTTVAATTQIVPATGWVVDTNGNIKLVAQDMSVTTRSPWQTSASCPVSQ